MKTLALILAVVLTPAMGLAATQSDSVGKYLRLPDALRGDRYEAMLSSPLGPRCHMPDVTWRVAGGGPPQGIAGGMSGIRGIPAETGEYRFVLEASNECQKVSVPVALRVRNRPVLVVSKESISMAAKVDGAEEMTASVLVGSDWADMPFAVTSSEPAWLEVSPRNAATPEPGSALTGVPVEIRVRTTGLKAGIYHARVMISMHRANPVVIPVTLSVKAW
ncbi:MAG: hypothetical protein SGI92_03050 [Bryobacteraceae bacterium]|nr:hypothetical protein [Bryobacteraceae bacterium]